MYVDEAPRTPEPPVDLGLTTLRRYRAAVLPQLSPEVPIELSPRAVAMAVNRDILDRERTLRNV